MLQLIKSFELVCLLVTLLCSRLVAQSATFDPHKMCALLPHNTKINDPRACNAWIECIDGEPVEGICEDTLFYDRETETCLPRESIECISSDPCAPAIDLELFHIDPYSCNGYYYCLEETPIRGECSAGMNYDVDEQNCLAGKPCVPTMLPENYCNIVPDGVPVKKENSCSDWEMCWQGKNIDGSCPNSFYYDAARGGCDLPQNVDCIEPTEAPIYTPDAKNCKQEGDFITDEQSCNGYYYCAVKTTAGSDEDAFSLRHAVCPLGRFFDPNDGGACVFRADISCSFNRCVGFDVATGIKLANIYNDDCRGYAVCQDGAEIGRLICPDNLYFDEVQNKCTTDIIQYPACVLSESIEEPGSGDTFNSVFDMHSVNFINGFD